MHNIEIHPSPCWYYDKADLKKSPSFFDGINAETEARYRREGPRFIFDMGTKVRSHLCLFYLKILSKYVSFINIYSEKNVIELFCTALVEKKM